MIYRLEVAPGLGAPVESPEIAHIIVADMFGDDVVVRRHEARDEYDQFVWLEQFLTPDLSQVVALLIAFAAEQN